MEKEKKEKAELEQLLNSLIEKGWKPFGRNKTLHITIYDCDLNVYLDGGYMNEDTKSFRELVSKESGLWQFVCKNGMVKNVDDYSWELYDGTHGQCDVYKNGYEGGTRWEQVDYEYRIIESALRDEGELEEFLLQNIVVQ